MCIQESRSARTVRSNGIAGNQREKYSENRAKQNGSLCQARRRQQPPTWSSANYFANYRQVTPTPDLHCNPRNSLEHTPSGPGGGAGAYLCTCTRSQEALGTRAPDLCRGSLGSELSSHPAMSSCSRVALVTGANKGIGFTITRDLCRLFSGDVVLTARDEARGRAAVQQLQAEGLSPRFHQLDITDLQSIRALRDFLRKEYGGLDVLVNNAAIAFQRKGGGHHALSYSSRGDYEHKLPWHPRCVHGAAASDEARRLNAFPEAAPPPLCHRGHLPDPGGHPALPRPPRSLPGLGRSSLSLPRPVHPGRVVNVSSLEGHRVLKSCSPELQQKFRSETITEEELVGLMKKFVGDAKKGVHLKEGWPSAPYGVTKIGVTVLSRIQARHLSEQRGGDKILLNACTPGWVRTDMGGPDAPKSPEEGAETPVYLALLPPDAEGPHGQFVKDKKVEQL
ncbi:carbonyl reductase [NADPH] 1-like isoform X2 [Lepus europaeus]|uniref:carbonyl reductase [NADPH] 1-like isoform X2 n=1 Tax=Lepus europaeus TaxID=9983 RepID=UPI002B46E195|nr:carbonyl reductase [NADPH] 1-like isoform X2 [Lepus europaeus]